MDQTVDRSPDEETPASEDQASLNDAEPDGSNQPAPETSSKDQLLTPVLSPDTEAIEAIINSPDLEPTQVLTPNASMDKSPVSAKPTMPRMPKSGLLRYRNLIMVCVLGLLAILVIIGFFADAMYRDKALPGATLAGADIGGQNAEQLSATVDGLSQSMAMDVTIGDVTQRAEGAKLGVVVDKELTVATVLSDSDRFWWILRPGIEKTHRLQLQADNEAIRRWVDDAFPNVTYLPQDSAVQFNSDSGVFEIGQSVPGQEFSQETSEEIAQAFASNAHEAAVTITLTSLAPKIGDEPALAAAEEANQLISTPVDLRNGNQTVLTLESIDLAEFVAISTNETGFSVSLDEGAITSYLANTIAGKVNVKPVAREEVQDTAGKVVMVTSEGVKGEKLDVDASSALVKDAMSNKKDAVELVVATTEPTVNKLIDSDPNRKNVSAKVSAQLNYLLKYANNYNTSKWGNYNDVGGDCANFTSQGLLARGISMDDTWYSTGVNGGSYAWISTSHMDKWMAEKGWSKLSSSQLSRVKLGDIGVFDWDANGAPNHVMTVSKIAQGTDGPVVFFASHNNDGEFRDIRKPAVTEHPNMKYWFYSVP